MNPSNKFYFWLGAALAVHGGRPSDLWRASNEIHERIASISDLTAVQFALDVLGYLRPDNEFYVSLHSAAIALYHDLTFGRAAEWNAAFDSEQL